MLYINKVHQDTDRDYYMDPKAAKVICGRGSKLAVTPTSTNGKG